MIRSLRKHFIDSAEIAADLEIPTLFKPEPNRIKKMNQFAYEEDKESIQDPKDKFKVNF